MAFMKEFEVQAKSKKTGEIKTFNSGEFFEYFRVETQDPFVRSKAQFVDAIRAVGYSVDIKNVKRIR